MNDSDSPNTAADSPLECDASDDRDALPYRPISRLSVSAFGLALASLVVLVGPPITIVIPLAATAVGLAAVIYLKRTPMVAGRRVANIALVAAVAMLVAGPTFWYSRYWQLRRTATAVADMWLGDLRGDGQHGGDLRRAHQLTLVPEVRFAPNRPLADRYLAFPQARTALGKFADEPVIASLRAHADDKYEFAGVQWYRSSRTEEWFALRYDQANRDDAAEQARPLFVVVKRAASGRSEQQWMVVSYALDSGEAMKQM